MGIRPTFSLADIRKRLDAAQQKIDAAVVQVLRRLGEMCVKEARENGGYMDQTGNLRSSIGYVIVVKGKIVESVFSAANKDLNGQGESTGKAYAERLAGNYSTGYALIVVAGMSYAAKVESMSKNVLTSAEMYAQKKLPNMLAQLKKNVDKMKL
ncbi:MAG TPA: HK97 gp10 family phage protein [Emticicia sp.]